ncbi:MAG: DNA alkylation repair protein [Candidatus Kapaibacterium sp.]
MKTNYFSPLLDLFEKNMNEELIPQMTAYMKNKFSYYGLKAPQRKELQKKFISENGKLDPAVAFTEIKKVWNTCNREVNYSIIDILRHKRYWEDPNSIELAEWLVVNKSWWDTVDSLAVNSVGLYMKLHPEQIDYYNAKWISSENIWLNRTAILFQLKYKKDTNLELLKSNIRHHSHQKEFFIKKAIGWSLREYSKINPSDVIKFLDENELQNLSIREASKYL